MAKKYVRKTIDVFVVQCRYPNGRGRMYWEDVTAELTRKAAREQRKAYLNNDPYLADCRIVVRREKKEQDDAALH